MYLEKMDQNQKLIKFISLPQVICEQHQNAQIKKSFLNKFFLLQQVFCKQQKTLFLNMINVFYTVCKQISLFYFKSAIRKFLLSDLTSTSFL